MQDIQLYVSSERLELFGEDSISITESIKNAKDIGKVFTTFSKQFSVPASKVNNRIFKHYYNYNIEGGNSFDARTKKDATLEINFIPFRKGKLKLDGVDLRNNKPYSYRVTFFGSVVELKDVLGEDKLPSLETALAIDDKSYSSSGVKTALTSGPDADGCLIPLISSQRLYYDSNNTSNQSGNIYLDEDTSEIQGIKSTQLKYAIKLSKLVDAIETKYDTITFASDSFFKAANTDFSKLYMWCHRKKDGLDIVPGGDYERSFVTITGSNEGSLDGSGYYVMGGDQDYQVRTVDVEIRVDTGYEGAKYDFILIVNDEVHDRFDGLTGNQDISIEIRDNFDPGDVVYFKFNTYEEDVRIIQDTKLIVVYLYETQGGDLTRTDNAVCPNITLPAFFKFNIAQNLPEMTIIDFLSSLFKMFNLVAYVNGNNEIEVQHLDDFYTATERNITRYVDVTTSQVNVALPYKEIFFKYADTGTILAEQHFQEIAQVDENGRGPFEWGGVEYTATDTNLVSGGVYKVEPDFHHAKYEKLFDLYNGQDTGVQVGYFVDDDSNSYVGSPLIMYVNTDINPNVKISLLGPNGVSAIDTTDTINMPSNLEDIDTATSANIHFNPEISEYSADPALEAGGIESTDTLFSRYYQSYIENIFDPKTRLIKVKAKLPLGILVQLQLSDVIILDNQKYRINSYTSNILTGDTNFELINYYA
jgi:hypothetical protein